MQTSDLYSKHTYAPHGEGVPLVDGTSSNAQGVRMCWAADTYTPA
jgi:hypothetical protein